MTAADLLARCRDLGIALAAVDDGALEWEAEADPPADLLTAPADNKAAVRKLLAGLRCPQCSRPLDAKRRCWPCRDRLCPCGRATGSALIELCCICGLTLGP